MRLLSPKLSKSKGTGRLHGRPIAAVHSGHPMLQCSPSKQSFAAGAKSTLAKTHSLRDKAVIGLIFSNGWFRCLAT